MKFAGTTAPQCCELSFNYFTVLLTGSSSRFLKGLRFFVLPSDAETAFGSSQNGVLPLNLFDQPVAEEKDRRGGLGFHRKEAAAQRRNTL